MELKKLTFDEYVKLGNKYLPEDNFNDEKILVSHLKNFDEKWTNEESIQEHGITKEEFLSVLLLLGRHFDKVQSQFFNNQTNDFLVEWEKNIDSFLQKTPRTKEPTLYRFEKYYELDFFKELFKSGENFEPPHYLTTSKDEIDRGPIKLRIIPLSQQETKARDLWKVYNQCKNIPYPEYQVNFERGAKFKIIKIDDKEIPIVYMNEI